MPWISGGGCLISRDFLRYGLLFSRKGHGVLNRKIGSELFFDETLKKFDVNLSIFKKNKADIQIRTYENGVGETLSCGSASLCVATKFLNQNQSKLKVSSMGGELRFKLDKNGILMSGPANFSYIGNINE